jgi:hypothetical protein
MRVLVVIELEVDDGARTGTAIGRAERTAESLASWAGRLRVVHSVHRVAVFHASARKALGDPLLEVDLPEAWAPEHFTPVARRKREAAREGS